MDKRRVLKLGIASCALAVNLMVAVPMCSMVSSNVVYAQDVNNDFSGSSTGGASGASNFLDKGTVDPEDVAVGNMLKNRRGMTGKDLEKASQVVSPLTNTLGFLSGCIIAVISLAIFLITAIDLAYIAVPPIRTFLYTPGTDGTGAMTAGRAGGYPMYGGGMMQGGAGQPQQRRRIQWISDECVQVCALLGGSSMSEGVGAMGRMGGFQGQPQNQMTRSSVIKEYLKKRAFFIVLFAVCIIILMSSVLMGTGVNIAQWGIKILSAINNVTGAV